MGTEPGPVVVGHNLHLKIIYPRSTFTRFLRLQLTPRRNISSIVFQQAICSKWRGRTKLPAHERFFLHPLPSGVISAERFCHLSPLDLLGKMWGISGIPLTSGPKYRLHIIRRSLTYWKWFPCNGILGDYCAPARGTMEIMRPEGHIMPPEGCIMPPEGCHRLEVEAARGRHNAARGWHNVSWGAAWFPLAWGQGAVNTL